MVIMALLMTIRYALNLYLTGKGSGVWIFESYPVPFDILKLSVLPCRIFFFNKIRSDEL